MDEDTRVRKDIPLDDLQEWIIALDEIAQPHVPFTGDLYEMQSAALVRSQRLAQTVSVRIQAHLDQFAKNNAAGN